MTLSATALALMVTAAPVMPGAAAAAADQPFAIDPQMAAMAEVDTLAVLTRANQPALLAMTTDPAVLANPAPETAQPYPSDAPTMTANAAEPVSPPDATADPAVATTDAAAAEQPYDPALDQGITVSGKVQGTPGDPIEKLNAESYAVVQAMDRNFVEPAATVYKGVLPKPVRSGLRNFLRNLEQPVIFINFVLQLKPRSALKTAGRFAINSTIGLGGLIDVAKDKPFNLPYRPNGFANTLGYYGVKPGAYMYLPLIGPTTTRDLIGTLIDRAMVPLVVGPPLNKPPYAIGSGVVRSLDYRVEFDDTLRALNQESADPYAATRDFYLAMRQSEIDALKGRTPARDAAAVWGRNQCSRFRTDGWQAWVNAMPGPDAKPVLHISGSGWPKGPLWKVRLELGPTTKALPPDQIVDLIAVRDPEGLLAASANQPISAAFPAVLPEYGKVIIRCGDKLIAQVDVQLVQ